MVVGLYIICTQKPSFALWYQAVVSIVVKSKKMSEVISSFSNISVAELWKRKKWTFDFCCFFFVKFGILFEHSYGELSDLRILQSFALLKTITHSLNPLWNLINNVLQIYIHIYYWKQFIFFLCCWMPIKPFLFIILLLHSNIHMVECPLKMLIEKSHWLCASINK